MAAISHQALVGGYAAASIPDIVIGSVGTPYAIESTSTTYTATGLPSVGASERAVIAIGGRAAATRTITGVTIGGQACSYLHHVDFSGSTVALYIGPVGATGNVGINLDTSWVRCTVGLWPCQNIQSATPTDTGGATNSGSLNDSMDCLAGGAIFGVAFNSTTNNMTWTNLTEAFGVNSPGGSDRTEGAADVFATAQMGRSITAAFGSAATPAMALVSLR